MRTFFLAAFSLLFTSAAAAEPTVWTVNTRSAVLRGDAYGVSIDHNGTISNAPRLTEVSKTGQQYVWSSAVDARGSVYLGTGGEGKIFRIAPDGRSAEFADLAELNVSALAISSGGEIYAATSPDGKVYRFGTDGKPSVYFDPGEKYIWSLAILPDGLAVATGDRGRIYKVRQAGASRDVSLLYDTSETNVVSLAVDSAGRLTAGTDPSGIVMRFGADGKPFGLLDSPLREVHELAASPDGSVYALVLGDSVAAPKASAPAAGASAEAAGTVSVEKGTIAPQESQNRSKYDLTSAKTAVLRIGADGTTELLWTSTQITALSLYAHRTGRGVLIGTSDRGRILNISNEGHETVVLQTDADQISTIIGNAESLVATSSNPGSMYRIGPGTAADGRYESSVLDAKTTAAWGRLWWRSGGSVRIQTRTGNTEKPDETWSDWSSAMTDPKGGSVTSPKARYFQWKATLGPSATLSEVSLAYLAQNLAPEILGISVLPTNVGLAANPPVQIDPNIGLSGLEPSVFGLPTVNAPPRRVFQRAAVSLQWNAEDRNGDKLEYAVWFRETAENAFRLLKSGLTENYYTIDGQSLADGNYIFKVTASDEPSNPSGRALLGERSTEAMSIDNTAPVVRAVGPGGSSAVFEAEDVSSYIVRAEYSINGGEWRPAYPDDGIADAPRERFTIEVPTAAGEYAVTLRVFDLNRNASNARTVIRR